MVTYVAVPEEITARRKSAQIVWQRVCGFPVLLACILVLIVFLVFPKTIADPDIGWHLRNAEYMVQQHKFLDWDLFSFTTAGKSWIDHEWLSELPFYVGWKLSGERGVFLVTIMLIQAIFLGIFGLAYEHSKNVKAAFIVSFLAIFLASVSFGPRTLLFGWICLIAELIILSRFENGRDLTWLLPPLFLLWINLHGSWMIGLVLLAIFSLAGCVDGNWGLIESNGWNKLQRKKLMKVSVLSVLALFVNPYGWKLVCYPFDMAFQQKLNIGSVEEWRTVDFHSPRGKIVLGIMAAVILLQLVRQRKWKLHEVFFTLVGLYAGFTYSRFLFLAAILILPILSKDLCNSMPYRAQRDKPGLNAAIMVCCLVAIVGQYPTNKQLEKAGCGQYPCQALQYLSSFHPQGNVFNEFRWGGYLIWNTRQIPVFIDSRVDIFEHHGVFADYLHAVQLKDSLRILAKYKIRYVIFEKNAPLSYLLEHTQQWKVDYEDDTTIVLEQKENHRS